MPAAVAKQPSKRKKEQIVFASNIANRFLRNIRIVGPFRLCLHFEDDFIAELDFEKWLKLPSAGPLRKPLREAEFFAQVYLDHGALTWPNQFDIDPFSIRHWAEQGRFD